MSRTRYARGAWGCGSPPGSGEAALAAALAGPDHGDGPGPLGGGRCCGSCGGISAWCWWTTGEAGRGQSQAAAFDVADLAAVVAVLDGAGIRQAHVLGVSLGGMVAEELAIDHPGRVDALVLAFAAAGWPFAYPMPAASLRLIADGSMTREVALHGRVENALSARGGREHGLADRLVELQLPGGPRHVARPGRRAHRRPSPATRVRRRALVLQGAASTVVDSRNAKLIASIQAPG